MFLAIAALALQTSGHAVAIHQQAVKTLEPVLSAGSAIELSAAVQKVAKLTEANNFSEAKAALRLLPSRTVKVEWDDSAVPASNRFDFDQQRESAFSVWQSAVALASFTRVKAGADIRVTFVDGSGITLTWSEDPTQPRLTAKIGLKQGAGPIDPAAVHNDLAFAIGSYFGVTRLPFNGLIMSGSDLATQALRLSPLEANIATGDLLACTKIRDQVMNSGVVASGAPSLGTDPPPMDFDTVIQGTRINSGIDVKNSGAGTLIVQVMPDCSCFARTGPISLKPNASFKNGVSMDTTEFTGVIQGGVLHHNLFLISNDAAKPIRVIPVQVKVAPRYRLLPNRHVIIANDQGAVTVQAYLYFPAEHPLLVTSAESVGLPGEVVFEPWQGTMADPDLGEGPLPRKGYKFTLKLKDIPEGSQLGTNISIGTDDPKFDPVTYMVLVQRGILASPQSLFMGEISGAPRNMYFMLTRPGKPFKITSLTTDSAHVKATYAPTQTEGEYRVSVTYDGKATKGDLHATVIVKTDDAKQKEIDIPVLGTVR